MPPATTAQRSAIAEFINFTKADKTTASRYLKANDWNVQSAVNAYYNDSPSLPSTASRAELGKIFDKYRDDPKNSPNKIGMDGTQKYCADIGVSVEDVSFFVLSEIVQSTSMGELEREPFIEGWAGVSANTLDKQKSAVAARTKGISREDSRNVLKRVYRHTFKLFLQPPGRSLDVETAIALWSVLFSPQSLHWYSADGEVDWFVLWQDFMRNKNKRPVNRDVWDQTLAFAEKTLEFGDVSFWSEDGAWPGVIDEFVEWVKTENPQLDPQKKDDEMEIA